jgi:hypothetical protein
MRHHHHHTVENLNYSHHHCSLETVKLMGYYPRRQFLQLSCYFQDLRQTRQYLRP